MSDKVIFTIRKDALWRYSTFLLLALIILGGFVFFLGGNNSSVRNVAGNNVQQGIQPSQITVSADDDPILGDANAPVEIIEFSDYQCPFCRKFWTETFHKLKADYIDTGKVKFVYRDFPLTSIHPAAEPAAEAANCVREQGGDEAYFKMHNKIFQEGNILDGGDPITGPVRGTVQFGTTELKKWAQEIGYDIGSCLDSGKYSSEVRGDLSDAQAAGGRGTPYFIINGKPLSGAQPYSVFKQMIEAELKA
jgi:protein-disulfide isomerase